jgi:zinc protease
MYISPSTAAYRFILKTLGLAVTILALGISQFPSNAAEPKAPAAQEVPWLYVGSDVPVDKEWVFGVLPNGLRYAVRRNAVPQHQVAVRVVIDAGALMERNNELGYAHFLEHLSFRGSKYAGDGEAKRVWQRLGTTFGSDTNAQTTTTQTVYKLDLPEATRTGLTESLKLLAGMMAAPTLSQAEVDAERRTVLAEARESEGAEERLRSASRQLFFAGQLLATRAPIGTTETLVAATPKSLRAFHDRWYRPDRTVIVICGDADPSVFASLIQEQFGDWKGVGRPPKEPDFGSPAPSKNNAAVIVEPGLPLTLTMAYLRPWRPHNDTIVYNQGKLIETVALKILNRRLEARARAGKSFLFAAADQSDVARSVDETAVQMTPLGGDWQRGLADVRAMIAEATSTPPQQSEIEHEVDDFVSELDAAVEQSRAESGHKLADSIAEAVNIRETVASPSVARDVFGSMKGKVTPAAILAASQHLFSGVGPRVLLSSTAPLADGSEKIAAALSAPVAAATSTQQAAIGFDRLPKLGPPGRIVATRKIAFESMKIVEFANGVKVMIYPLAGSSGRIFVSARFGNGRRALPADRTTVAWAANGALVAGGIGDLGLNELDTLMNARRLGLTFELSDDAFALRAQTNDANLLDQLKLMATKLAYPRWDAAPVERTKALLLAGQDTVDSTPQNVLAGHLQEWLVGNDPRWKAPTREDIASLTPENFRALWEPLLKTGPIELQIFGDMTEETAIKAAAATFGALKPREAAPILAANAAVKGMQSSPTERIYYHKGDADQAAAVLAWPTSGGVDHIFDSRKLDILGAIFNDRLFEKLREGEGAAYSPNVLNNWGTVFPKAGNFVVMSQVKPNNVQRFFELSLAIAADLSAKPVSADEFERAIGPTKALIARAVNSDLYWMNELAGGTRDPHIIDAALSIGRDLQRITPLDVQSVAKTYLGSEMPMKIIVLPKAK